MEKLKLFVVLIFSLSWFYFSQENSLFGDEGLHFGGALSIIKGAPGHLYDLDTDQVLETVYFRGQAITKMAAKFYNTFGVSLRSGRLTCLVFTLLTCLLFLLFVEITKPKDKKSLAGLILIIFFGQSAVLEESLYLRMYSALGFAVLAYLVCIWVAFERIRAKHFLQSIPYFAIALFAVVFPYLDSWQLSHLVVVFISLLVGAVLLSDRLKDRLLQFKKVFPIIILALLFGGPIFVRLYRSIMFRLGKYGLIVSNFQGDFFSTYWDNIAAFIRAILFLNIALVPVIFWKRYREFLGANIYTFLYFTGLISTAMITLYVGNNHIFYTKYFYAALVPILFGVAGIFHSVRGDKSIQVKRLMIIYVGINLGLSAVSVWYERPNMGRAIALLEADLPQGQKFLASNSSLVLHQAQHLISSQLKISSFEKMEGIGQLISIIEVLPQERIFFLYEDGYWLRDNLYTFTTGKPRYNSSKDLYRYLRDIVPKVKIYSGLHSCGLVVIDKSKLIDALKDLQLKGFAPG